MIKANNILSLTNDHLAILYTTFSSLLATRFQTKLTGSNWPQLRIISVHLYYTYVTCTPGLNLPEYSACGEYIMHVHRSKFKEKKFFIVSSTSEALSWLPLAVSTSWDLAVFLPTDNDRWIKLITLPLAHVCRVINTINRIHVYMVQVQVWTLWQAIHQLLVWVMREGI